MCAFWRLCVSGGCANAGVCASSGGCASFGGRDNAAGAEVGETERQKVSVRVRINIEIMRQIDWLKDSDKESKLGLWLTLSVRLENRYFKKQRDRGFARSRRC